MAEWLFSRTHTPVNLVQFWAGTPSNVIDISPGAKDLNIYGVADVSPANGTIVAFQVAGTVRGFQRSKINVQRNGDRLTIETADPPVRNLSGCTLFEAVEMAVADPPSGRAWAPSRRSSVSYDADAVLDWATWSLVRQDRVPAGWVLEFSPYYPPAPPARLLHRCPYVYRGPECGYTGSARFTIDNASTAVAAEDRCNKSISACALRFFPAPLRFGGLDAPGSEIRRVINRTFQTGNPGPGLFVVPEGVTAIAVTLYGGGGAGGDGVGYGGSRAGGSPDGQAGGDGRFLPGWLFNNGGGGGGSTRFGSLIVEGGNGGGGGLTRSTFLRDRCGSPASDTQAGNGGRGGRNPRTDGSSGASTGGVDSRCQLAEPILQAQGGRAGAGGYSGQDGGTRAAPNARGGRFLGVQAGRGGDGTGGTPLPGAGGGSGGFLREILTVTPGQRFTWQVGQGGQGGNAPPGIPLNGEPGQITLEWEEVT